MDKRNFIIGTLDADIKTFMVHITIQKQEK